MRREGAGEARGIGLDEMVRDHVGELPEPETREPGQDPPLVGDAGTEDDVEGGDPVGGDEEDSISEVVDVAHLAAPRRREPGEEGLEKGFGHSGILEAAAALDSRVTGPRSGGGFIAQDLDPERAGPRGARRRPCRVRGRRGPHEGPGIASGRSQGSRRGRRARRARGRWSGVHASPGRQAGGAPLRLRRRQGDGDHASEGAGHAALRRENAEPERGVLGDPRFSVHAQAHGAAEAREFLLRSLFLADYGFPHYKSGEPEKKTLAAIALEPTGAFAKTESREIRRTPGTWRASRVSCATSATRPRTTCGRATSRTASRKEAKARGVKVTVLDKKAIRRRSAWAVFSPSTAARWRSRGSSCSSTTAAGKAKRRVALVGKGVTFDSGGISIKPAEKMGEMKWDMMGAATAIGVVLAAADLRLAGEPRRAGRPAPRTSPPARPTSRATSSASGTARPPRSTTRTPRAGSSSRTRSTTRPNGSRP